jgi:hypothetical protein
MTATHQDPSSPFAVLEIAPTLDPARVKLAYFAVLAKHPPHADPQGFRAIRDAYESLQGDGLRAAHLAAPLDLPAEAAALGVELGVTRAQAVERARSAGMASATISAFEALLRLELPAALAATVSDRLG